jgi:hypothetical protein
MIDARICRIEDIASSHVYALAWMPSEVSTAKYLSPVVAS